MQLFVEISLWPKGQLCILAWQGHLWWRELALGTSSTSQWSKGGVPGGELPQLGILGCWGAWLRHPPWRGRDVLRGKTWEAMNLHIISPAPFQEWQTTSQWQPCHIWRSDIHIRFLQGQLILIDLLSCEIPYAGWYLDLITAATVGAG